MIKDKPLLPPSGLTHQPTLNPYQHIHLICVIKKRTFLNLSRSSLGEEDENISQALKELKNSPDVTTKR
jgi:hypothetical protein